MKDLIIKNGIVFDPLNGIEGEKKEIHVRDGVVVDKVILSHVKKWSSNIFSSQPL